MQKQFNVNLSFATKITYVNLYIRVYYDKHAFVLNLLRESFDIYNDVI